MFLQARLMKGEELAKKREEAERKARRGEIDPTHEFTFQLIGQFSGLLRHEIMDYMFNDPAMLDDLDYLYKSDNARYYPVLPFYLFMTHNFAGKFYFTFNQRKQRMRRMKSSITGKFVLHISSHNLKQKFSTYPGAGGPRGISPSCRGKTRRRNPPRRFCSRLTGPRWRSTATACTSSGPAPRGTLGRRPSR